MSCFFCSSNDHVTLNCNVYKSNEERKMILKLKNFCSNCLSVSKRSRSWCINCKIYQKCFCCFSRTHHTVYCPHRFTVSALFPPKIDKNLFSRFLEMLELEEKYYLAFSFPMVFALIKLKPIKITYREHIGSISTSISLESDVIVAYSFCNYRIARQLNFSVFRIKKLCFNLSYFFINEIFHLLSTKTNTLTLLEGNQTKPQKLIFQDIFEKAPNLEKINLLEANIKINSTWPMDLLQQNLIKKLNLSFSLSTTAFNIKKLADLVKSKPITIHLNITESDDYFLVFSFPSILTSVTLKPLRITLKDEMNFTSTKVRTNSALHILDKATFGELKFPETVFRIRDLIFFEWAYSATEFLQLLSPKTTVLKYFSMDNPQNIEIQKTLTFRDILKKAPNLEGINLFSAHFKISNSWPSDILELNHAEKLTFYLSISDVNFDIENLAQLFRTKRVKIHFNITPVGDISKNDAFTAFKKNLKNLFIQTESEEEQSICITSDNNPSRISRTMREYFILN